MERSERRNTLLECAASAPENGVVGSGDASMLPCVAIYDLMAQVLSHAEEGFGLLARAFCGIMCLYALVVVAPFIRADTIWNEEHG